MPEAQHQQARPQGRTNDRTWPKNQTIRTRPPTAGQPASPCVPKQGASDSRREHSKVIRYNQRLYGPQKRYSICRPNWMAG